MFCDLFSCFAELYLSSVGSKLKRTHCLGNIGLQWTDIDKYTCLQKINDSTESVYYTVSGVRYL